MSSSRRQFLKLSISTGLLATMGNSVAAGSGAKESAILTLGVIADPQYVDAETKGSRYYRASLKKLEDAVAKINGGKVDAVITLGDIIDREFESFAKIMPIYSKLDAPHYAVLGNHDLSVADDKKEAVYKAMGMPAKYYSKKVNGVTLLFLDGTEVSTYAHAKDSAEHTFAKSEEARYKKLGRKHIYPWNSAMSQKQLDWLDGELKKAKAAKSPVMVMSHFPVLPAKDGHNLWNDAELVAVLEKYDHVLSYFNGHNHKGNYTEHKGAHFVNFKGMVETEKQTAFAVVRVYQDRIEIDGMGVEPDRSLK